MCRGCVVALVFIVVMILRWGIGARVAVIKDMQLTVFGTHTATTKRRLTNLQQRRQAAVSGRSRGSARADNNQPKVAAKMFTILLGLCNILNITKENSG